MLKGERGPEDEEQRKYGGISSSTSALGRLGGLTGREEKTRD